ncbi:MAG: hypothetical protein ABI413_11295, partial [Ktedonobacteraceae bacterium]
MDTCKYRQCGKSLEQRPGGRKREYCDDACRQAAHRAHTQEAAKLDAITEIQGWGHFLPASVEQLAGYIMAGNRDAASKVAEIILAEQQAAQPRQDAAERITELESEIKRLNMRIDKQYVKKSAYKADAQELEQARADLLKFRQERAREQEQYHQLYETCRNQCMHLETAQQRIKDLEIDGEQARRGAEQVQESYRQYVAQT